MRVRHGLRHIAQGAEDRHVVDRLEDAEIVEFAQQFGADVVVEQLFGFVGFAPLVVHRLAGLVPHDLRRIGAAFVREADIAIAGCQHVGHHAEDRAGRFGSRDRIDTQIGAQFEHRAVEEIVGDPLAMAVFDAIAVEQALDQRVLGCHAPVETCRIGQRTVRLAKLVQQFERDQAVLAPAAEGQEAARKVALSDGIGAVAAGAFEGRAEIIGFIVFEPPLRPDIAVDRQPQFAEFGSHQIGIFAPIDPVGLEAHDLVHFERGNVEHHLADEGRAERFAQRIEIDVLVPDRIGEGQPVDRVFAKQLRRGMGDFRERKRAICRHASKA